MRIIHFWLSLLVVVVAACSSSRTVEPVKAREIGEAATAPKATFSKGLCPSIPSDWRDKEVSTDTASKISFVPDVIGDHLQGLVKQVIEEVSDIGLSGDETGRRVYRITEYNNDGNRTKLVTSGFRISSYAADEKLSSEAMLSLTNLPFDRWVWSGDPFGGTAHSEIYKYDVANNLIEWQGFNEDKQLWFQAKPVIVRSPLLELSPGRRMNISNVTDVVPGSGLFALLERQGAEGQTYERFYYYREKVTHLRFEYDVFGKLSSMTVCSDGELSSFSKYLFDGRGQLTSVSTYGSSGKLVWKDSFSYTDHDSIGNWTRRVLYHSRYDHIPPRPMCAHYRSLAYY